MHSLYVLITALLLPGAGQAVGQAPKARVWTDSTDKYSFEADLIGQSDDMVVLQRRNREKDLVAMPIEKLSRADQAYLKSKEASESLRRSADQQQVWAMRNGLKVIGRIVEYGRRQITIQRKRGTVYVNDRPLKNYPELQQRMLFKVVAHLENLEIDSERQLEEWLIPLKGSPRTFTVEGVMMELENGDVYGVPFFFFAPDELKILEPGWQRWLEADRSREQAEKSAHDKEREEFMLRTAAETYQRDRQMNQQIKMMELELLATAARATDLWEVQLFPKPGVAAYPRMVVVPGGNSDQAKVVAMERFPGFVAGSVAQVNRP